MKANINLEEINNYLKQEKEKYIQLILNVYTREELIKINSFFSEYCNSENYEKMTDYELAEDYVKELLFKIPVS